MSATVEIRVKVGDGVDAREMTFRKRDAWMMRQMIDAGSRGVSSLEHPGRRLSHYVLRVRRAGIPVETIDEKHTGPFAGRHGRYRLATPVAVLAETRA